jgi:hypothetical protein
LVFILTALPSAVTPPPLHQVNRKTKRTRELGSTGPLGAFLLLSPVSACCCYCSMHQNRTNRDSNSTAPAPPRLPPPFPSPPPSHSLLPPSHPSPHTGLGVSRLLSGESSPCSSVSSPTDTGHCDAQRLNRFDRFHFEENEHRWAGPEEGNAHLAEGADCEGRDEEVDGGGDESDVVSHADGHRIPVTVREWAVFSRPAFI